MPLKKPNIILTIADDQRGSALGCAGLEPVSTPALDALAARGTRFTQSQHLGSCHGAVCAPSRAMLHTGIPYFQLDESLLLGPTPVAHRVASIPRTLGQKLRGAGYHAFGTGKWHNGAHSFHPSFDSGANIFLEGMADHWFTRVHDFDPAGLYAPEAAHVAEGFSTEVFAQSAIDFIQSRKDDDPPFFCYCAFTAPHDPRTPPDAWRRKYDPSSIPLPPNIVPRHYTDSPAPLGIKPAFDHGASQERDELLLGIPRDAQEIRRAIAEYYGMISHMDDWIGRIHQAVGAIGQLDNTIVIHTSDHGLALGQHGLLGKQNLYQHSLQIPLILAGPGIPVGNVSHTLCYQHDLHPTLAHLVGAEDPSPQFQNLLPALQGAPGRTHLGAAFRQTVRSVRDARYKLIEYRVDGKHAIQLFDLAEDPWEIRNLGEEERFHPLISALQCELGKWQHLAGDPTWHPTP